MLPSCWAGPPSHIASRLTSSLAHFDPESLCVSCEQHRHVLGLIRVHIAGCQVVYKREAQRRLQGALMQHRSTL